MPPKSPLWNYFRTNKQRYKLDQTHNNAWCDGCISAYVRERKEADTIASTGPSPTPPWSDTDLEREGQHQLAEQFGSRLM